MNFTDMTPEPLKHLAERIAETFVEPDAIIGLGSGEAINAIVQELKSRATEVKRRRMQFHCTKRFVRDELSSVGIIAFWHENVNQVPYIDYYFECPDVVCIIPGLREPVFIKSDLVCQYSAALKQKSRYVYFLATGQHVISNTVRGIPLEIANNMNGHEFFKEWTLQMGGVMGLRCNIDSKHDRFYAEWVPPPRDLEDRHTARQYWKMVLNALDENKAVLGHNFFASSKCQLLHNGIAHVSPEYKRLFKKRKN